jgi:hypothetical protein
MVVTVFRTFVRQHQHKRGIPAAKLLSCFSDSRCRQLLELAVPADKKLDVLLIVDKVAERYCCCVRYTSQAVSARPCS